MAVPGCEQIPVGRGDVAEMIMNRRSKDWELQFTDGEREARRAAGEWTGETLGEMARRLVKDQPDRQAVVEKGANLTYGTLLDEATALAKGLAQLGLEPGDTVSFQLPNWTEAVILDLACSLGGFVINPIPPIYRQHELRFILNDCRARVIFVPDSFRGVGYPEMLTGLRGNATNLEHIVVVRGKASGTHCYEDLIAEGRASEGEFAERDADSTKMIMYTSGTTGQPKGVLYTQNQLRRPLWVSMKAWGLSPGARLLMPSPVSHVTGFAFGMEMPVLFGTQTYFMDRWDAERAVEIIEEHKIEFMVGATPFLAELVGVAEKHRTGLKSLRIFACGGAAVPPELIRRANRAFANGRAFRVFGSTECFMITQGCLDDDELAATTDGRVYDWDVKIVDRDGQALGANQEGEVLARGAGLFRGYTSAAAACDAFDPEGYFRTGDLGVMTGDGVLTITGRKKDIIIRGGENISAKEIEDALHEHPAISEVAVVAMPHERLGEGVCAFVIAKQVAPSLLELCTFLDEYGLARQKWPERVDYVDELPKNASGKVQKHALRKAVVDRIALEHE